MLQQQPEPAEDRYTSDYETVSRQASSCPECEGGVVDGQGLLGCVNCDWVGVVA